MNKTLFGCIFIVFFSMTVSCSQEPPESKAIELVKKSYALPGGLPVELFIENFLKEKKDNVKPIGWEVTKNKDRLYLVSYKFKIYSFTEGTGERGYFFEVNLDDEVVRNVTSEFERKMKPLSSPYKDEKELMEELIGQEPEMNPN